MKLQRMASLAAMLMSLALVSAETIAGIANPTPVSYLGSDNQPRVAVFVKNLDNGHLAANHFNGSSWYWVDHGLPPGATSFTPGTALTYVDASGKRQICVYGVDQTNTMFMRQYNGLGWSWQSVHSYGKKFNAWSLSSVTYINTYGTRIVRIAATTYDDNSALGVRHWNGSEWIWMWPTTPASLGPNGSIHDTGSIAYLGEEGIFSGDAFVSAFDGQTYKLFQDSYTVGASDWKDHGGDYVSDITPLTYLENGVRKIYVWARSGDTVRSRRYNGTVWFWVDSGLPIANTQLWDLAATTYLDLDSYRQMHVFALVSTGARVYRRAWDGNGYVWMNQNKPDAYGIIHSLEALSFSYAHANVEGSYLFAVNAYGSLVFNHWNGSTWQWVNNGQP